MMTLKAPLSLKVALAAFCLLGIAGCNADAPNPSVSRAAAPQTRFANRADQVHAMTGENIKCPNDYRCFQAPE
jgi:hypothetical protein